MQEQVSIADILRQGKAPALYKVERAIQKLEMPVVQPLVDLLGDSDFQLRRNAAWLLRKYGDTSALMALMNAVFDSDVRVRQYATIALGALKDPEATEALLLALHDNSMAVRLNAIRALGLVGDPTAISYLIPILENETEDHELQAAAAQALGRLQAVEAIPMLYNALDNRHKSIHVEASMALARIGEPALEKLVGALQIESKLTRQRRRSAAAALGWMVGGGHLEGKPAAITLALDALIAEAGTRDKTVRYEIAQALAATGDYRALEPLIIGLRYDVPPVRRSSAKALKEMAAASRTPLTAIVAPLIDALQDSDTEVQYLAVEALGMVKDARVIEPLFGCLDHDDPEIRYRATLALGETGDASVVKPLTRLLRDKDPWIRRNAALALGRMGHSRAVRPLIVALSDPNADVRQYAAMSLGQLGDQQAVKSLLERLVDDDQRVIRAAQLALLQLGYKIEWL